MEKNALKGWNNKSILDVGVKICILAFLIVTLFNTIFYEFKINANIKRLILTVSIERNIYLYIVLNIFTNGYL